MVFSQLLRVLRARIWLTLFVMLAVVGAAVAVSLLVPKRYASNTVMVVDFPANDPVLGGQVYMQGTIGSFLATQVDIIRSERVIKRALAQLKLEDNPVMKREWLAKTGGKGAMGGWLVGNFLENLLVEPSRDGAGIVLTFEAADPQLAADIANGITQAYVYTTLDMKTEPARNYAAAFEEQARQYRAQIAESQARLSAFQQQSGITANEERFDVENTRLQELSSQLVALQGTALESRSRSESVRRGDTMPEVVANPLISSIKTDISRVEQRLDEQGARFGSNHPQYIATQAELAALKTRLDTETDKVLGSISTGSQINNQREAQLRNALEVQRARVLSLKKQRDQLAIYQREVETAQRALELLSQRVTATNVESRSRQSNVNVVSSAFPNEKPSRPNLVLNLGIGTFFGLLLGIIAAITMEAVQRPIRSSDDLLEAAGVPILAVLPPAGSRRRQRLIGETGPSVSPNLRLGDG
jgi:succinoglycan biosynthesis transport protein ExoP